jgi:hypothetical protein
VPELSRENQDPESDLSRDDCGAANCAILHAGFTAPVPIGPRFR